MRKLFSFLFLVIPLLSFSETVELSGNAQFFANEKIQVFIYSNLLTKTTKEIAQSVISENGDYQLKFNLDQPKELIVKIEMREFFLMAHPGSKFTLNFLPIKNPGNQRVPLRTGLKTNHPDPNLAGSKVYNELELSFAAYQLQISKRDKVASFYNHFFDSTDIQYQRQIANDTLFSTYYSYFKANAFLQSETSKTILFHTYINQKPIQYDSKEYLKFFKAITFRRIHKYLSQNTSEVADASSEYRVYDAFMKLLANDAILAHEEIRSLSLLLYCMNSETNPILSRTLKNGIINQISNFSTYPTQKKAALIYQANRAKFSKGNEAPEFTLYNEEGEDVKLSTFRGHITYLAFINSKSRTCVRDLQVIENIKRKYRKVRFLIVVCDRDSTQMDNLPSSSHSLTYLFINKDYQALEDYQIWNFPMYYLIDKHGYFLQSPAKRPENIIDDFKVMFAPKSARKRYEIIKD